MEATTMSREIERERESTRPERENPTLSVPAIRRAEVRLLGELSIPPGK